MSLILIDWSQLAVEWPICRSPCSYCDRGVVMPEVAGDSVPTCGEGDESSASRFFLTLSMMKLI